MVTDEQRLRPAGSEVQRLCCDATKLHELTSFTPEVSLEAGLEKSIAWFTQADNLARYKAKQYNV